MGLMCNVSDATLKGETVTESMAFAHPPVMARRSYVGHAPMVTAPVYGAPPLRTSYLPQPILSTNYAPTEIRKIAAPSYVCPAPVTMAPQLRTSGLIGGTRVVY